MTGKYPPSIFGISANTDEEDPNVRAYIKWRRVIRKIKYLEGLNPKELCLNQQTLTEIDILLGSEWDVSPEGKFWNGMVEIP